LGFPGGSACKESACNVGPGFEPWVGKISLKMAWQPTPVFLPGESHRQRALRATVHGVTKSKTLLSNQAQHTSQPMNYSSGK